MAVSYSTVGWDLKERSSDDSTVALTLEPVDDASAVTVLRTGLSGRSTWDWIPSGLETKTYRLRHVVVLDGVTNETETLEALFSFANNPYMRVDDETVIAAMRGSVTEPFAIENDATHPWAPISAGTSQGIRTTTCEASTFGIIVEGAGVLSFDFALSGGTTAVTLDGYLNRTLSTSEGSVSIAVSGRGKHAVRLAPSLGTDGSFAIRNVCWVERDSDLCVAETTSMALNLTNVWDKTDLDPVTVSYSSVGWDLVARAEDGSTVRLELVPTDGSADSVTLQSGLTGRATWSWTPSGVAASVYRLVHYVVLDGATNSAETLEATFSFENNPYIDVKDSKVIYAMSASTTLPFAIVNDASHQWIPANMYAREGVRAPVGQTSTLEIDVTDTGVLTFDYALAGGSAVKSVDGAAAESLSPGAGSVSVPFSGRGRHTVRLTATLGATDSFTVLNVRWVRSDDVYGKAGGDDFSYDLQPGVRLPRTYRRILPFVHSPTNFTGAAGAGATSLARVTVVRVTGDEAEGIESWTNAANEVSGTKRVLVEGAADEGSVKWTHAQRGVWKATYEIVTGDETVRTENAFFDLRVYNPPGMAVIVR